jgi:hypothetical protein
MAHRQHGASRFYLGEFVLARVLFRPGKELRRRRWTNRRRGWRAFDRAERALRVIAC